MQPGINKYQNLLKLRYHAIGFIALINFVFFFNYAIRETVYKHAFGITRLGIERVDTLLILTCIAISVTIFVFSWMWARQYPLVTSAWYGNKLPLKTIFAAGIVVFVFVLIGAPTTYLGVHLRLGQSSIANKLLGIVYFVLGNICIMAIIKGNFRRFALLCAFFVGVVMFTLEMRSLYIVLISLPVIMIVFSGRAMLWAPVVLVVLLAGAVIRSGYYSWDSLMLQTSLLVWAPAYQLDVYASQGELANVVSQSYVADGGGVGSFIALDFEQYFPFANGLIMTSLFPIILTLFSKAPISNAVIIALAMFYPIAARNNFESYMPVLILFVAGGASVFFYWGEKDLPAGTKQKYLKNE